jgi:YVTN family beta-propeller protein
LGFVCLAQLSSTEALAQVTTTGFANAPRAEAPGTLLSHPVANGSEPIGRTTSINYLNGWIIVGGESPGSRPGSDLVMRVYDISNPAAPVRRLPTDFGLALPNNQWHQGNVGWRAHGTAQWGSHLLPQVVRVATFGGPVELGGTNGIPSLGQVPVGYDRASQAGPWDVNSPWYDSPDDFIAVRQVTLSPSGQAAFHSLATFDHMGEFGGGDWHSMIFGDLLILARSGSAASDGVVVYRLEYINFDDPNPNNRQVIPHYVGSLDGGFHGYWPNLFSDGTGLYVVGSTTNILIGADITQAAISGGDGSVVVAASLTIPGFTNASYPVYQDQFAFIHNRKIDMTQFLAGDANPIVLTLNEVATGVDTTQMSLALGNLWLTGGYPHGNLSQGLGVWVHQQAPDTIPPRVSFHIPEANRTNYPRHAPLSFLVHEHPRNGGPRNGIDFSVRPVLAGDLLGDAVAGFLIMDFSGVVTFTPASGLDAETTYQVDFHSDPANGVGFADAAGNPIEPYTFRFSTGGGLNSPPLPTLVSFDADNYQPAPNEVLTVEALATGDGPFEYRFNFEGAYGPWDPSSIASYAYSELGRPRVLVQARDIHGAVVTGSLQLLVAAPMAAGPQPSQSRTLAVGDDPLGRRVWVVNPDSNSVSVLDAASGALVAEHAVGENPRNIARDAQGRYWVTCQGSDELYVLNPDGSPHHIRALAYGAAPFGVVASPNGQSIFVTLYGSGRLQRYVSNSPGTNPVEQTTFPTPRAIAVSANGQRVFVTRFISPELHAEVAEFAGQAAQLSFVRGVALSSANTIDNGDRASGVPNYLAAIAISPDGTRAAVASKQDNVLRGELYGVGDLTHETTVRAVVSFLDLQNNVEIRHARRDFDNSDSPSALGFTPRGDALLVALQGNNAVAGIDMLGLTPVIAPDTAGSTETSPAVRFFDLEAGLAPQGILLDPVSQRLFTQNFMGRSVTVRNAAPFLVENRTALPELGTTSTVAAELLPPAVLEGKRIFYNAADPRMSADSYISCASCHVDGGSDGRVWDFTGRGEGLRRTTDLRGRSGMGHGNVHWSANFDEIQDFEHDIRGPFGGVGFLSHTPEQFALLHPRPSSGKAGLSEDLDALAAYVASLSASHIPRSPHRNPNGTRTAAALRGEQVFEAQGCTSCHSGAMHTNSAIAPVETTALSAVGTQSMLSGGRLGSALTGIDTPTLDGIHQNRAFLHHGGASTLDEVFVYAGGELLLASSGELLSNGAPGAVALFADTPLEGGGGFFRGALGGVAAFLGEDGSATPTALRFEGVDGGPNGGTARVGVHYVRQYNNGTASIRVNGVAQPVNVLRQFPDNSWQVSGWRWLWVNAPLLPGPTNTVEVVRGNGPLIVSAVLVSNAEQLLEAHPHHRVGALTAGDRADLLAYLLQLDGRDEVGAPFAAPPPPAPAAPSIVSPPQSQTLAVGSPLQLSVVVAGTGPFTFQWWRNGAPISGEEQTFFVPSCDLSHSGTYTVEVSSAHGSVMSEPALVTINPALEISTAALPVGTVGQPLTVQLMATGGVSSRTWELVSAALPPGLSLSQSGVLSGTPTVPVHTAVTVRVSDTSGSDTRALTLHVAAAAGPAADPDLILHYTFDEGAGSRVWDAAPAGNDHASTVAAGQWVQDGRFGGAFGPAGTNQPIVGFFPANQNDLDFDPRADAFTISLWLRTTTTASYNTLFGKDGNAPNWQVQYRAWVVNPTQTLQAVNGGQYGAPMLTAAPPLNDGQWHLVTLTNRNVGGTWRTRLYFDDGALFQEFNTGPGGRLPYQLRIGDTGQGGNPWVGQLDDVRIYRRALEPEEVGALFTADAACAGVVCDQPPSVCHEATGVCEPATGSCTYALRAVGSPCDDGIACTVGGACNAEGNCGVPVNLACNDGVPCTADTCSASVGCQHVATAAECVDFHCPTAGDLNGNGMLNVSDAACSLLVVASEQAGTALPGCLQGASTLADINCNGAVNVADVQLTISLILLWAVPSPLDLDANTCVDACQLDACGDGVCTALESCNVCPVDCGGCEGDCCAAHTSAGCDDAATQECVCDAEPACCNAAQGYSQACVNIAQNTCGATCN